VVFFNENELLRTANQVFCHGSEAGAGLDDERGAIWQDLIGDPAREVVIDEEVLPHAFARGHFLAADDSCVVPAFAWGSHAWRCTGEGACANDEIRMTNDEPERGVI
jgi:hypothetical protein